MYTKLVKKIVLILILFLGMLGEVMVVMVGLILVCGGGGKEVWAADSQTHLENVQRLLTGKIARIVDYDADSDPNSVFTKRVKEFGLKGYNIFNFSVSGYVGADDPVSHGRRMVEFMRYIDTITGRENLYIPQIRLTSRNPDGSMGDRLSNGQVVKMSSVVCPNFAFLDIADPAQRSKYLDFVVKVATEVKLSNYNSKVIGYLPIYGMWGETGLYIGDEGCSGANGELNGVAHGYGDISAGYSEKNLSGFKQFYIDGKDNGIIPGNGVVDGLVAAIDVNNPGSWPKPSNDENKGRVMTYFLMYRKSLQRSFNGQIVQSLRAVAEEKAIASFCYLPVLYTQAVNGWADFPGADFCMTQIGVGTYGTKRKILETDCVNINDYAGGTSCARNDSAWFEQEVRRTIRQGGNVMTFNRNEYWNGPIDAVSRAIDDRTNLLQNQYIHSASRVALMVPTYTRALAGTEGKSFMLKPLNHNLEVIKRLNNLGVSYDLITEDEMFDLDGLSKYKVIIFHDQRLFNSIFPIQWQKFLGRYAGAVVGDNNGSLDYGDVETAVRNRVLNTADNCASLCNDTSVNYLVNPNCKKTCAVSVPAMPVTATPTIILGDYDGDGIVNLADFGIWKGKYLAGTATLVEFGMWKREYLK